ncbi:MAG: hypothetical protein M3O82_10550 [Verrucomicrobiota bacterium]|nr:hypothetical protein [Verrucomicrobiota bacterium]
MKQRIPNHVLAQDADGKWFVKPNPESGGSEWIEIESSADAVIEAFEAARPRFVRARCYIGGKLHSKFDKSST